MLYFVYFNDGGYLLPCSLAHHGCNAGSLVKSFSDLDDTHFQLSMDVNINGRCVLLFVLLFFVVVF